MQMTHDRHTDAMHEAISSYVRASDVPRLDECAVAARREALVVVKAQFRPRRRMAVLVTAAVLIAFLFVEAPVVVAQMQRVFAAFALVGGRPVPMTVRLVDLAKARADVPFDVIAPPQMPNARVTVREVLSSASPASDSVAFELTTGRSGPPVSIVETRDGGGPRQLYLSENEPSRDDAKVTPNVLPKFPGLQISVVGKVGSESFTPLTWVTRGTRIVLMSPPGALSTRQIGEIRSAMTK